MSYLIIFAIVVVIVLLIEMVGVKSFSFKRKQIREDSEILKILLNLNENSLIQLFELYKNSFGTGPAYYARRTYKKWKSGKVKPNEQTVNRFLFHLPKVMSYDLKCEVLRHLMQEFCQRENYKATVFIDDWENTLTPLVQQLIDKPFNAELPLEVQNKLTWLADGEMQIAQEILRQSQVEEGKIAVSQLRREFENIEKILEEKHLNPKVSHELKFPYGTITLNIKRR